MMWVSSASTISAVPKGDVAVGFSIVFKHFDLFLRWGMYHSMFQNCLSCLLLLMEHYCCDQCCSKIACQVHQLAEHNCFDW